MIGIVEFFDGVSRGISLNLPHFSRLTHEDNKKYGSLLKKNCIEAILASARKYNLFFRFIDMPYNSEIVGKGLGVNVLEDLESIGDGLGGYCLVDVVDGTWAAVSGCPFSGTTTLAVSLSIEKKKGDLTLADFEYAAVIPHEGDGWYLGRTYSPTLYIKSDRGRTVLGLSPQKNPKEIRFVLDLFTTQTYSQLEKSIDAVKPIMLEWADFVRLYGAGIEITTMFSRDAMEPSVGAYISANQKMDNVIPLSILVEGAGGIVTDWWGNSIADKKLEDRVFVAMSANETLHENILNHFKNVPVIEGGLND